MNQIILHDHAYTTCCLYGINDAPSSVLHPFLFDWAHCRDMSDIKGVFLDLSVALIPLLATFEKQIGPPCTAPQKARMVHQQLPCSANPVYTCTTASYPRTSGGVETHSTIPTKSSSGSLSAKLITIPDGKARTWEGADMGRVVTVCQSTPWSGPDSSHWFPLRLLSFAHLARHVSEPPIQAC